MNTIIEPFRIKSVEPIHFTTESQRQEKLQAVGHNLFGIKAEDVIIDLLIDRGTSAMSAMQWAGIRMAMKVKQAREVFTVLRKPSKKLRALNL